MRMRIFLLIAQGLIKHIQFVWTLLEAPKIKDMTDKEKEEVLNNVIDAMTEEKEKQGKGVALFIIINLVLIRFILSP